MCDYSLMGVPNRLAREGEDLVLYEFPTGSQGLTPDTSHTDATQKRPKTLRSVVNTFLGKLQAEKVAACIPPGARLLLRDIPEDVQRSFRVGPVEEVTFTQLSATANTHRDAVRFDNGREIMLQQLDSGQRVRVLRLALLDEPVEPVWEPAELFGIGTMRIDFIASRLVR